jgi:hypothetical protein
LGSKTPFGYFDAPKNASSSTGARGIKANRGEPSSYASRFTSPSRYSGNEEKQMKRAIWAVTALSLAWLLATTVPDIRRYVRMITM